MTLSELKSPRIFLRGAAALLLFACTHRLYRLVKAAWIFAHYPFEYEWADGDVASLILRITRGLPIYGDWDKGDVLSLYTPLYYYVCAGLQKLLGHLDTLHFAKLVNIAAFAFFLCIAALSAKRLKLTTPFSWLIVPVFLLPLGAYYPAFWLRPDTFLWLTSFAVLLIFAKLPRPDRSMLQRFAEALLLSLPFYAKQPGIAVPASVFLFWAYHRRWKDLTFLAFSAVLVNTPIVLVLEVANQGAFIKSVLFSTSGQASLETAYLVKQLREVFEPYWFLWALVVVHQLQLARARALDVWSFALWIHMGLGLHLGRHLGGGCYYFVLPWIFLAVSTLRWASLQRSQTTPAVLLFVLALQAVRGDATSTFPFPFPSDFEDRAATAQFMKSWLEQHPAEPVLMDRMAGSLVALGKPTEIEACNLAGYIGGGQHRSAVQPVLDKIRARKYSLVTVYSWLRDPELISALEQHYVLRPDLKPFFRVRSQGIQIDPWTRK